MIDADNDKIKKVVIIQRRLTHYRVPVFNQMKSILSDVGVELVIVYGDPTVSEKIKNDTGHLDWGTYVPCHYFLGGRLCWQNPGRIIESADLIVITQELKLLYNYFLQFGFHKAKIAYWGHGKNFNDKTSIALLEFIKSFILRKVDWWFAYTDQTVKVLLEAGFSIEKITTLNNAIDTKSLTDELNRISEQDKKKFKRENHIQDAPIGIAIGSLYPEKRIGFLIESLNLIRKTIPDYQLLIVGDGPDRVLIESAIKNGVSGLIWLGARTGRDKALALSISNVMLNSGSFGLTVLDSFAANIPQVFTEFKVAAPEAAYLIPNFNCLVVPDNIDSFSTAVVNLLNSSVQYEQLRSGCESSAAEYTVENMINNFCTGIRLALVKKALE
jgi:L-malate glycosyltransferase